MTLTDALNRRAFLRQLGGVALTSMMPRTAGATAVGGPLPASLPHFAPRAKQVIYLTMIGGTSQVDLLDPKPALSKRDGQVCPDELFEGKPLAFIRERPQLLGTRWGFERAGQAGVEVSDLLPHLRGVVDRLTVIRSMQCDEFNHTPAELQLLTGFPRFGRPSVGAWVSYGLGSLNQDLPAFVALVSGGVQPASGSESWGSGFLSSRFQGVEFRQSGEPVLFVENPPGVSRSEQRQLIDAVGQLNRLQLDEEQDPEIEARIAQYEMAFRMQMAVPSATDIWSEPAAVHEAYGTTPGEPSFANHCLLARRLVERGVRFVQLFNNGWDHHQAIVPLLPEKCREIDRPAAALVADLHQRGLLDETLVVWASEFGRTPMGQSSDESGAQVAVGRDHQRDAFTIWMAGGGVQSGLVHGRTHELGHTVVEDPVHVHDLNATLLHLLGIDHLRLTHRHQGRDFRLTDVHGRVVHEILA